MTQTTVDQVLDCLRFEQTHESDPRIWSAWSKESPDGVDRYRIVVTVKDTGGIKLFDYHVRVDRVSHPMAHKEEWKTIWSSSQRRGYNQFPAELLREAVGHLVYQVNDAQKEKLESETRKQYRQQAVSNVLARANETVGGDGE